MSAQTVGSRGGADSPSPPAQSHAPAAPSLADYEPLIGRSALDELGLLAEKLRGRRVCCINATRVGGGVAEILNRMVPLVGELGVAMRWEILKGTESFYKVTKKMHNALHGKTEPFTPEMFDLFRENTRRNLQELDLDAELFFIHDPQPIALVEDRKRLGGRWVWRCHIDVSNPQRDVWNFLRPYILQYDTGVYSAPAYVQQLPLRQVLIAPSIDPLSDKNRDLPDETVQAIVRRLEVRTDWPLITQISRFDYLKDPLGVVDAFRLVRKSMRCRLLLAGGSADDDPEGQEVLNLVRERVQDDPDIQILLLPPDSHVEINALQRASTVVLQKSLREGFGLTVSEALWKGRPVVASAVGGIPLQIKHGYSGLLVHSIEGAARAIKQLLRNPDFAARLGQNGREHVRQHFLLTRQIRDYLLTFATLGLDQDVVHFGT